MPKKRNYKTFTFDGVTIPNTPEEWSNEFTRAVCSLIKEGKNNSLVEKLFNPSRNKELKNQFTSFFNQNHAILEQIRGVSTKEARAELLASRGRANFKPPSENSKRWNNGRLNK
jgi:hypothetical protein